MFRSVSLFALILVVSASPVAAKKPVEKVVVADTAEKFELLVDKIHGQMAPGKRYEFIDNRDRGSVDLSFKKMAAILATHGSVDAMPIEEKTRLFNEQEKVNGLLAKNADDRLVCAHAPVGSHLPVTSCKTVREIANNRENSRRLHDEMINGRMGRGPGG